MITELLTEYFTKMSDIALKHGCTIDKFISDAILIFFGDPETKGVVEDAKACLRMSIEMQHRLAELNAKWRYDRLEHRPDVNLRAAADVRDLTIRAHGLRMAEHPVGCRCMLG